MGMSTKLTGDLSTDMVYAIYGSNSEFGPENTPLQLTPKTIKPKYEGKAIYELFKGAGIRIYPIATDLEKIDSHRTYRSLSALPVPSDVVISCLGKDRALKVVEEAADAGVRHIFFQPRTDSSEALSLCKTKGIEVIKGCMLRHWSVSGLTRFISPCFYMGLGATKLPVQ
jgi:predicted CoA-binding protein